MMAVHMEGSPAKEKTLLVRRILILTLSVDGCKTATHRMDFDDISISGW